ncbi:MAG TPA: alpha/beta fold hydrolase [Usitatibacter sp.]|nr:alpha/beta fold hydrolase [Usitatibacter sp.]
MRSDGIEGSARAADGYELAVTRFPAQGAAWATMCIAAAMGVKRDFYAPIARFFAGNGIHVLTFDYRGMGGSRRGSLAALDADIRTWAEKDLAAMLVEARNPDPYLPLVFVGHSLGGQVIGVTPGSDAVRAVVTANAGSGYYRLNDGMRFRVRLLWFFMFPVFTRLFGYFPGKRLRMVGDLPKGVARQWRRWCLHPEYLLAEGEAWRSKMAAFNAPILRYSFSDDRMINERATDSLHSFYRGARVDRRHIVPSQVGEARIGHFGFFHERSRDKLWREALEWLRNEVRPGGMATAVDEREHGRATHGA